MPNTDTDRVSCESCSFGSRKYIHCSPLDGIPTWTTAVTSGISIPLAVTSEVSMTPILQPVNSLVAKILWFCDLRE